MSFDKKWVKNNDSSTLDRVKDSIKSSDPLKSKLQESISRIDVENRRLDQATQRFQNREKMVFDKIVEAYSKHDNISAGAYANELVEIRKLGRMILQVSLALEQISLRMKTVTELGDVAVSLMPVIKVIQDIKPGMDSINPQTEKQLGEIGDLLNGIVADTGMVSELNMNFDAMNEDSSKILDEAIVIHESKIGERFPVVALTNAGLSELKEGTDRPAGIL
jgi:division protein CdvB (Snf7/Vps24/ESCRT-III family)